MTELTQFRDHARFMATQMHAPGCPPVRSRPSSVSQGRQKFCGEASAHDAHQWQQPSMFGRSEFVNDWHCAGICGGCVVEADRVLWHKLATEIDDHLAEHIEVDLFGNEAAEPDNRNDEGADS